VAKKRKQTLKIRVDPESREPVILQAEREKEAETPIDYRIRTD
jgi:hypothetical protein